MLEEVLVPRVAAVSELLPWSSDELELICGLSSSDSSGEACQPQSSEFSRCTGAAMPLVAGAEPRVTPSRRDASRTASRRGFAAPRPPGDARRLCLALDWDLPQSHVTPYLRITASVSARVKGAAT